MDYLRKSCDNMSGISKRKKIELLELQKEQKPDSQFGMGMYSAWRKIDGLKEHLNVVQKLIEQKMIKRERP